MRELPAITFLRRPSPNLREARLLAGTAVVTAPALIAALCLFASDVWAQTEPEQGPSKLTTKPDRRGHPAQLERAQERPEEISGWTNNVRLTLIAPQSAPVSEPDPDSEPGAAEPATSAKSAVQEVIENHYPRFRGAPSGF